MKFYANPHCSHLPLPAIAKNQANGKGKREQFANAPFRTNKISVLKKEIYISSLNNTSK
jgi:hypothetical protein